ncbi:MAG: ABC transporter, partial [Acidobacteria bacterium]|nr:ABC transporter [Acidobacteriota bacterium]
SDFISNGVLGVQGNRDFFMNTVNWLAQQENLIAIRPREPEDRRLTLTADQQSRIFWLSVLLIPGLVFAAGVYNWYGRR